MDNDPSTTEQPVPNSGLILKVPNRTGSSGNQGAPANELSPGNRFVEQFPRAFLGSAALILILTGIAKLVITANAVPALDQPDPVVWFMTRRGIAGASGLLEILVGFAIIVSRTPANPTLALGFLCSLFLLYRTALMVVAEPVPCGCLGDVANLLKLTDSQASAFATLLLAYLCLGTAACKVLSRVHRVTAHGPTQGHSPGEPNVP